MGVNGRRWGKCGEFRPVLGNGGGDDRRLSDLGRLCADWTDFGQELKIARRVGKPVGRDLRRVNVVRPPHGWLGEVIHRIRLIYEKMAALIWEIDNQRLQKEVIATQFWGGDPGSET